MTKRTQMQMMSTTEVKRRMRKLFDTSAYDGEYALLRLELLERMKKSEVRRKRYLRSERGRRREGLLAK